MKSGDKEGEIVIPVIAEELHVNAVPVSTGGVRIIKRLVGNEEPIEQELCKGTVVQVERQWIATEEVHISRREEKICHQEKLVLQREEVSFERFDKSEPQK
jgi:stress response protein YsnF